MDSESGSAMNNYVKALFLIFPLTILIVWALYFSMFTKSAQEVTLPIMGYDPRNILSGHYLQYQIDWKRADCYQADWQGVCPTGAFKNIDKYYVPENQARDLEQKINAGKGAIVFAYQKGLRPIAKRLVIDE